MLIRERYPKFIDALRDLDDCLTMVHLFATLPAIDREKIEAKRIHNCRGLSLEWQAYISRTHKLRKAFISVKGIYYQPRTRFLLRGNVEIVLQQQLSGMTAAATEDFRNRNINSSSRGFPRHQQQQ